MKRVITPDTKLIGLFGSPLKQSFSPEMHNKNFKIQDYNCCYIPVDTVKEELKEVMDGMRSSNFIGANITKPNKIEVIKYLDDIDEVAEQIGAVNTVKVIDGRLKGYNTDGLGFIKSLEMDNGVKISNHTFFLHGCGGAGRSIAFNLANKGAKKIILEDTSSEALGLLYMDMKKYGFNMVEMCEENEEPLYKKMKDSTVYINATGLGMYPDLEEMPCEISDIKDDLIVCDLTYNPLKTKLLVEAEKKGCKVINGLGMVIHQGALAYEIWTTREAPVDTMGEIIKDIVGKENHREKLGG